MSKKNLKEIVYDSVLNSIYSSEYRANEIITETSLIQKYGYSKSPIREALTALCHEGVLKNIPRCGYQVIALTSEDVQKMLEYRMVLETGMLRLCFDTITENSFCILMSSLLSAAKILRMSWSIGFIIWIFTLHCFLSAATTMPVLS